MKIEFIDDDNFIVYYYSFNDITNSNDMKELFLNINKKLKKYNLSYKGFYKVDIYNNKDLYILEFNLIDEYYKSDFDITIYLNSTMYIEIDDLDLVKSECYYYLDKIYINLEDFSTNSTYEYSNILYGNDVSDMIECGKKIIALN